MGTGRRPGLPFAGAFDLAVSFGAFGHFLAAERPALFAGVYRALRPGGVFAFPIGAPQPITSPWYWALLGFDLAMRVRNAVWRPPFVMYYRTCPPQAVRNDLTAAVQLGARMVEAGDSAPDITRCGGVAFGLDREVADDVDALARLGVLEGDPGRPYHVDLSDGRAVQLRHRSAGPAEENVGYRGPLGVVGIPVDIEHDFPGRARLHPVEVAQRHHGPQARQVDAVGVAVPDMPGQGAKALPEARRPARSAAHAAARADGFAVASLEVRTPL